MKKEVIIIGGGIIGLCSAYYLQKEGHSVTIIDQYDITSGASFVNAGYITPSHIIPLSSPGIITKGLKWMFNSASPFYVKPRLNSDFLTWAWQFKKSATSAKVVRAIPIIEEINLLSRDLFEQFKKEPSFKFHYHRKGLLMAYQTNQAGEEEWEVGKKAIQLGLEVKQLNAQEIKEFEPDVLTHMKGAVYFGCDAHSTPGEFMKELVADLKQKGVSFLLNEEVEDLVFKNKKIEALKTTSQLIRGDEFILTGGAWSPILAKKIGLNLSLQAGKGYRINVERETKIKMPTILLEAKVAVTPMNGFTRFAGTMELGGINHNIDPVRVNAIAQAAKKYYPEIEISKTEKDEAQCGLRPCSPDGLPYIGKSEKCKNLIFATGHAMMGWSLGPITGKLVSEISSERKTSMDIAPFHPDRKF
ncbi:NAD(P)/FAD-dependent oxidoreductase [Namhaeicola litoreus]|uniref:NAD(P)/FAD-dependent oxidoreductase n=1 Tax=Namhaeicola litoreus TaxID=1052145 RepID=A0ABW3XZC1_9FLAO